MYHNGEAVPQDDARAQIGPMLKSADIVVITKGDIAETIPSMLALSSVLKRVDCELLSPASTDFRAA